MEKAETPSGANSSNPVSSGVGAFFGSLIALVTVTVRGMTDSSLGMAVSTAAPAADAAEACRCFQRRGGCGGSLLGVGRRFRLGRDVNLFRRAGSRASGRVRGAEAAAALDAFRGRPDTKPVVYDFATQRGLAATPISSAFSAASTIKASHRHLCGAGSPTRVGRLDRRGV